MNHLIYILPLLFSLADALMYRAKTKPVIVLHFNIFLELSKLFYIAMIVVAVLIGQNWQNNMFVPLLLLHFVAKSIPFNIVAGLKWNYIGTGIFDRIIRIITMGSVWMWLLFQGIFVTVSYYILMGKI